MDCNLYMMRYPISNQCFLSPLGDTALQVRWEDLSQEDISQQIQGVMHLLDEQKPPGLIAVVPAFETLILHYDPTLSRWGEFSERIGTLLAQPFENGKDRSRTVTIPCCYDIEFAWDLISLAELHAMEVDQVIALHTQALYRVQMIGFSPGFPYLAGLSPLLEMPRRSVPRLDVPTGSVAIGGKQTGIYPSNSPGGWNIIGRTPIALFDPQRQPPCLLKVGDRVRFIAISREAFREGVFPWE